MARFFVLADKEASYVRGMTSDYAALEPVPLAAGGWVLPIAVGQDRAHMVGHIADVLGAAQTQDLDEKSVFYDADSVPAEKRVPYSTEKAPLVNKSKTELDMEPGNGTQKEIGK